jgi:hypothetical protein
MFQSPGAAVGGLIVDKDVNPQNIIHFVITDSDSGLQSSETTESRHFRDSVILGRYRQYRMVRE